jgi:hypothetical protein
LDGAHHCIGSHTFAPDTLRTLEAAARAYLDAQKAEPMGWINVAERLPEICFSAPEYRRYVRCLTATKYGWVAQMDYKSNGYAKTERGRKPRWEYCGRISQWDVTHWMPLPAHPSPKEPT